MEVDNDTKCCVDKCKAKATHFRGDRNPKAFCDDHAPIRRFKTDTRGRQWALPGFTSKAKMAAEAKKK